MIINRNIWSGLPNLIIPLDICLNENMNIPIREIFIIKEYLVKGTCLVRKKTNRK
jgi:hypothetical protein